MKKLFIVPALIMCVFIAGCDATPRVRNTTAMDEQGKTELNQRNLNEVQPAPSISRSLERDNLIKRFKMMNDRSISFYMYIFIEGVADPIGYYQINKVSSVNSQLTNTQQIVDHGCSINEPSKCAGYILPSPAEDGSYGTNGDGVFGFTPEGIYIEHNMKYIVSAIPLTFTRPVNRLAIITTDSQKQLDSILEKIK